MKKPTIVMQSDFGIDSGLVACMHGMCRLVDSELETQDITHLIPAFDIEAASYCLQYTVPFWPDGTVFVSVVDPGVGTSRKASVAKISLGSGITAIIGTWILSTATCIADIMRYAKSTKAAVGATLTGLLIGNVFMILCGAITTIAVGTSDLTEVLLSMGLVIPSLILMTTNIFTTNASNLYSTSLNLSNALKTDRKKIIVVLLVLSALATLTKPYQIGFLFSFLDLLGTVVPPLAGIILVDFYLLHKKNYPMLEETEFKNFNVMTWISWVVSIVLANVLPIGLPSLTGLVLGGIIYFILMKLTGKKVFRKIGE